MEKSYSFQSAPAGEPVRIEITFHGQDATQAIQLRSNVGIHQGEPAKSRHAQRDNGGGVLDRLERIRNWERSNLPQWNSYIAHDIFRLLGAGHPKGNAYTIKQILHATGCSEGTIRQQLRRFEQHGWITRRRGDLDRRNCYVLPTESLKASYQQWLQLHEPSYEIK